MRPTINTSLPARKRLPRRHNSRSAAAALTAALLAFSAGTTAAAGFAGGTAFESGGPIRIFHAQTEVLEGQAVHLRGSIGAARPGREVALQIRSHHRWESVATALSGRRGRFALSFTPHGLATYALRLRVRAIAGSGAAFGATPATCAWPACAAQLRPSAAGGAQVQKLGVLRVFREVIASWYGGGGGLACGGYLTSATLGVANRTLPCGTMVTLRYGRRSVRVPVIDRGPFVAGREYDLTEATRAALGFPGLGALWSSR